MASGMSIIKENESEENRKVPRVYKIYVMDHGYKPIGVFTLTHTIEILEGMILNGCVYEKILVIEKSKLGDCPVLLYTGNIEDFLEFKKVFSDAKVKRYPKIRHDK